MCPRLSQQSENPLNELEYFMGLISQKDVESCLKEVGEFAVRVEQNGDHCDLILSVLSDQQPEHIAIFCNNGNHAYSSLDENDSSTFGIVHDLVDYYQKNGIKLANGKKIDLLKPAKRSDYQ
ncbi:hypothetical protein M3Y94_00692900 [Aphelenchoides besseyi]|nr:hypothetical protein M3Y94_00692900 [Aphelenchoides besseyi]